MYNSLYSNLENYFCFCNTGCILISAFASLFGILIGIMSGAIGLKICAIAAWIN